MCGGSDDRHGPKKPENQPEVAYNPPSLDSLYQAFRESGTVPYSYYGAGAPTREGELDIVRKQHPGAFPTPATPPPAPTPPARPQMPGGPFGMLFSALRGRR
jgi:hypothetical protein